MKILLLSIVDPMSFPGGAGTYLKGFIDALCREPLRARVEWMVPGGPLARFHRVRQMLSLFRSLGSRLPSKALFQYSRSFRRAVASRLSAMRPDVVVIHGADLLWLLDDLPVSIPAILVALNVEHELFSRQVESLRVPKAMRRSFSRDSRKLRDYELQGIGSVSGVVFVSPVDASVMQAEVGALNALCVPPIFPYPRHDRMKMRGGDEIPSIGLMANFGWWRNRVSFRWFLRHVLQHVKTDLRFHLYGVGSVAAAHADPRLTAHGYVEDLGEIWERCDFMICPGIEGSGVNVKLAEAVYNSMPVLATLAAARALSLEASEGIVLSDQAEDWVRFLNGPACSTMGSRRVPQSASDRFSVDFHLAALQQFIRVVAVC